MTYFPKLKAIIEQCHLGTAAVPLEMGEALLAVAEAAEMSHHEYLSGNLPAMPSMPKLGEALRALHAVEEKLPAKSRQRSL